jgi:putative membrane protein
MNLLASAPLFAFVLPENFWVGAVGSLIFGVIGIVLLILGYFAFDIVTPKLDVPAELTKGNVSVGIVVAALLLAIAYIAANVVQ